jgi:hypothetical protein
MLKQEWTVAAWIETLTGDVEFEKLPQTFQAKQAALDAATALESVGYTVEVMPF